MMDYLLTKTPLIWLFQSYWRDEAFSVILAQKPILELLQITAKDFSPPLYYILLKFWMMLLGDGEVATRSLSLLALIILIATLVMYFRKIEKFSILEVAIVGFTVLQSPILTYYAFETRMYSWAALYATVSWLAIFKNKRHAYIVLTILGLYTHYFHVLVVLTQIAYLLLREFSSNNKRPEALRALWSKWISVYVKICIAFAPWIIMVIFNHNQTPSSFWIKKPSLDLVLSTPAILATGYEKDFNIPFNLAGLTVFINILIIVSGIKKVSRRPKLKEYFSSDHLAYVLWYMLPAGIIALFSSFGPSLFLPRYLIVSSPALIFILADELKNKRLIFSIVLISIILIQMSSYQNLQIKYRTKENLGRIFADINIRTNEGDALYLESELDFHLAQVYFKYPERVYIVGKPYSELPTYVGKSLIPEDKVSVERPPFETGSWLKVDRSTPRISN